MTPPTSPAAPPTARPSRVRYRVLAALCLAAVLAYVQRNTLGMAERTIRLELGRTREQMGLVLSAFGLVYALCQLPSGWLPVRGGQCRAVVPGGAARAGE